MDHHTLQVEERIEGVSVEEVYDGILVWLSQEKASIKEMTRPTLIRADHGTIWTALGWNKNAKKTLRFLLSEQDGGVVLQVVISVPWYSKTEVQFMAREASRNWTELIQELLRHLGVTTEPRLRTELHDPARLNDEQQKGTRQAMLGAVLFSISIPVEFINTLFFNDHFLGDLLFYGLLGYGVFRLVYGLYNARGANKRLSELSLPEKPKKLIGTYVAVLLILMAGAATVVPIASYFQGWASTPEVYSKYGLSFEYLRGMSFLEKGAAGENIATNNSGQIVGVMRNREGLSVAWVTVREVPDMEEALDICIRALVAEGFTVVQGELVTAITNSGHRMLYVSLNCTKGEEITYSVISVWYCDISSRFFYLGVETESRDVFPRFEEYRDSFTCHQ